MQRIFSVIIFHDKQKRLFVFLFFFFQPIQSTMMIILNDSSVYPCFFLSSSGTYLILKCPLWIMLKPVNCYEEINPNEAREKKIIGFHCCEETVKKTKGVIHIMKSSTQFPLAMLSISDANYFEYSKSHLFYSN